uniref:Calcium voltage-gated channel auxiliary subunit gamma 6 n=1 Tax=Spermophilus dauricus TaxID=99837 RepID=A0A8C9PME9_SPEDA
MMWSNFFMQEEDRRRAAAGRRRAQGQKGVLLTPEQEGKIKLVLLLVSIGATLAVLAVGTEFWVELNTYKANSSAVCDAAHLGLWKVCTKRLWLADVPEGRETCGPAELPGEANCTYFKFFTTGENARVFQRTTKKEVNIAAAVIAVLGLVVMALGCLCVIMVLSKGAEFLLRVGAVCFVLSGEGGEPGLRALHAGRGIPKNCCVLGGGICTHNCMPGGGISMHCCMLGFEGSPRAIIGSKTEEFQALLLAEDWTVYKYHFDLDPRSPRIVARLGVGTPSTAACQEQEGAPGP